MQKVEMLESPRCIKSHLPVQLLPEQLWTVKPKAKYPSFTKSHDKRERTIKNYRTIGCEVKTDPTC